MRNVVALLVLLIGSTSFASSEFISSNKDSKQQFKKIKNRWKSNQFIHIQRGTPQASTIQTGWHSAQWSFENVAGGFVRIKNRWKGTYLHNQNGRLTVGKIDRNWWSAQWKLERVGNFYRIKNRWKNTYLHVERGQLQLSGINQAWHSAQWSFPSVTSTYTAPKPTVSAQRVAFPANLNGAWKQGQYTYYKIDNSRTIRYNNATYYVQQTTFANGYYKILTESGGRYTVFHVKMYSSSSAAIGRSNVYANRDAALRASRGSTADYRKATTPQQSGNYSNNSSSNTWPTAYFPSQLNGSWKFSNGAKAPTIRNSSKIEYQGYEYTVVKTTLRSGIHKIIARYGTSYYYSFYFKVLTQNQAQYYRSGSYQSVAQAEQARMGNLATMHKSATATWKLVSFPASFNGNWHASSTKSWMYEFKNSRTIRARYATYNIQNTSLKGSIYKVLVRDARTGFYHAFYISKTATSSSIRMSLTPSANYANQVTNSLGQMAYYYKQSPQKKNTVGQTVTNTTKKVGQGIYDAGKATGTAVKKGTKAVGNYFSGGKKKAGSKYITFQNTAGYVAKFGVKYRINGQEKKWSTGDMALGNKKNFKIPPNATNIQVNGRAKKAFGGYKSIFKWRGQSYQNKCYKAYGTIFSPKYNNNCK